MYLDPFFPKIITARQGSSCFEIRRLLRQTTSGCRSNYFGSRPQAMSCFTVPRSSIVMVRSGVCRQFNDLSYKRRRKLHAQGYLKARHIPHGRFHIAQRQPQCFHGALQRHTHKNGLLQWGGRRCNRPKTEVSQARHTKPAGCCCTVLTQQASLTCRSTSSQPNHHTCTMRRPN